MHELAIGRAILDAAVENSEGRQVVLITITVGALRQVVPDSLAFNFETLARGTLCEGARLDLRFAPARLRCECEKEWELEQELSFRCPRCSGAEVTVLSGDELSIDSIEVVDEEEPCTAQQ
ncbi:MAG: hydrogenase maturation nickel metallochaperone HypA [Solirubrobacterales bacterium]